MKLSRDPLCEVCLARGILTAASHVHHKIEVKEDRSRALDDTNLQSLCHPCHSRYHATGPEAQARA